MVTLAGACSSEDVDGAFDQAPPRQLALAPAVATGPAVGDPCTSDAHCGRAMMCVDKSVCMCRIPLAACSRRCVDVQTDRANCGSCGVRCGAGAECVGGTCTDAPLGPGVTAASVGTPFNISPFSGSDCRNAHEAVPVWYPNGGFGEVLTSFNRNDTSPVSQGNDFATA